jgi:hypothetical protein
MARLLSPIGIIQGKIGGLVFKRRGGKTYISSSPRQYTSPKDPASIQRKKKFAWVVQFSKAVNNFPLIKALWIPVSSKWHPPYQNMFKQVFESFPSPRITPGFGFQLLESSVIIGKSALFVEAAFSTDNLGLNLAIEKSILAAGILVLSDPIDERNPSESFLQIKSGQLPLQAKDNPGGYIIPLTGRDRYMFDQYKTKQVFICLVTLDGSGKPVHYSSTFSL